MHALAIALHALAAAIWVGGMFFAYVVLRPSLGDLAGAQRLALWRKVLDRFFRWVIASILVLIVSGYLVLFGWLGGFAGVGVHVHIMQLLGWIMFALFLHLYFAPWRRLRAALDGRKPEEAATALAGIRRIVAINLALGLLTIAIGASGRFWP
jgi:uncharacterized membrane protein